MAYLRQVALDTICTEYPTRHPSQVEVTQIGKTGFHFKVSGSAIPGYMIWEDRIKEANEGCF